MKQPVVGALVVAALALCGACSTEKTSAAGTDAGRAPLPAEPSIASADAGTAADAGVKSTEQGEDAGSTARTDAGEEPAASPASAPAPGVASLHDRILVKPKAESFDVEAVRKLVEKRTGQKLKLARRSARRWVLLEFEGTARGRSAEDQQRLVEELRHIDDFSSVEADRVMKLKSP